MGSGRGHRAGTGRAKPRLSPTTPYPLKETGGEEPMPLAA